MLFVWKGGTSPPIDTSRQRTDVPIIAQELCVPKWDASCLTLNQLTHHHSYRFTAHLPLAWSAAASQHFCISDPRVHNNASRKRSHKQSWEKCLVHTTCSIRIHWRRHWANPTLQRTIQASLHREGIASCPAVSGYTQPRLLVHSACSCFILLTAPSFLFFFFHYLSQETACNSRPLVILPTLMFPSSLQLCS